ncbi:molybdopterin oxidoreductase family protein [Metallosphaera hakonensis]|uniref:molybdopterin oxidoreductase family protein n=1 Tax=Metallosphaera hakonensis TaxID=79601 RepID=UPI00278C1270|nr:molybdopterin-dependent oxidoreductase [Metallosphaera hakonensis]
MISSKFRKLSKVKGTIGIYMGAQIPTEDQYLAVKLGKGYLGTPNFDSNVRLCMASAAHSLRFCFGDPSPTISYDEIDRADTFFLVGVNPASNFPVLWNRIISRRRKGGKIIVVDPIYTDSASLADIYVRIKPGRDIVLLNSIANAVLYSIGDIKIRPEGFDEFKDTVDQYPPERASSLLGIEKEIIVQIAKRIMETKTIFMWGMGVNQTPRAVETCILISTLAMITGNVGEPGTGVLPLTGQHNSMGAREAGALAGMLPGLRYVDNDEEVREVEDYWRLPRYSIPRVQNTITDMYELMEEKKIKALWIIGTNPVISLPEAKRFQDLLSYLDLIVVQDSYLTETAKGADIVLPASTWSEREGIHTAGDRTVGYLSKLRDPPGEAKPDWEIIRDLGLAMGFPMEYNSVCSIFEEFKGLTKDRIDDISSLNYKRLDNGFRWHGNKSVVRPRMFRTKGVEYETELDTELESVFIITGRTKMHWNTRSRSSRSWLLSSLGQDDYIFIGNDMCLELGIETGEDIEISTKEGKARATVKCVSWISGRSAFMPFHWGRVNRIMDWKVDPISKEPAYKLLKASLKKT